MQWIFFVMNVRILYSVDGKYCTFLAHRPASKVGKEEGESYSVGQWHFT